MGKLPKGCARAWVVHTPWGAIAQSYGWFSMTTKNVGDHPFFKSSEVAIVPLDGRFKIVPVKKPTRRKPHA